MKEFNTTGLCIPEKHYMVDISDRLAEIKRMVDAGKYFCINRARQYGKTTTLAALADHLSPEYNVLSLDFQGIGNAGFATEESFVQSFAGMIRRQKRIGAAVPENILASADEIMKRKEHLARLDELFDLLSDWCAESSKPMVLMIDEVDSAANNQVFLDFLAQLRLQYLEKEKNPAYPAFCSVILAGVTDVRHLKAKIRPEGEHKENSPWNIASEFNVDMSLSEAGIRGMLEEYEADHHTGMNMAEMAKQLRGYTGGYPYLVSRLCQLMDGVVAKKTGLSRAWTEEGLDEAIKILLADGNDTLFGSLMSKLANMPKLKAQLRDVLMKGEPIPWQPYEENQALLSMYGFIRNRNNTVAVANRIFEMLLYQYFLGESEKNDAFREDAQVNKSIFIDDDGTLNIPLQYLVEAGVKRVQIDDRVLYEATV